MQVNKIYCGDCLIVVKDISDNSIDLVVTSPPYFNAKKYYHYKSINDYMKQMEDIFTILLLKIKKSRMCVINISPVIIEREKRSKQSHRIPLPFYFVPMMEKIGFEFLEDIIWVKPDGSAKNRNGGFYRHRKPIAYKPNIVTEYILVFKKPAPFLIDKIIENNSLIIGDYERTNVWKINPDTNNEHPAPFPEELVDKIIRYYSYKGDIVLDPMCGSGTTCKMAKINGRKYIGIDISEEYCEISRQRIKAIPMKYKFTCLQCANKGMDGRDKMYCTAVRADSINSFGFLWNKKDGYKETPKWCPLQEISLKMIK